MTAIDFLNLIRVLSVIAQIGVVAFVIVGVLYIACIIREKKEREKK